MESLDGLIRPENSVVTVHLGLYDTSRDARR